MAITATPYGNFLLLLGKAFHDFTADSHKVALLTSDYTPNFTDDYRYDDLTAYEVTDDSLTSGGYVTGGASLASKTYTYAAGVASLNADPIGWTSLTTTFRYALVYKVYPANPLIGLIDFGADRTYNAEPFQLTFTNGVIRLGGA